MLVDTTVVKKKRLDFRLANLNELIALDRINWDDIVNKGDMAVGWKKFNKTFQVVDGTFVTVAKRHFPK